MRMLLQCSADLERASHGLFRAVEKQERHPVSSRHSDEFACCFCRPKMFGGPDDLVEFLQQLNLLVNQQFRITDKVD
jgi:hypothetical protein